MRIDLGAFDTFRQSFGSFGLGTKTEIDLPGEGTGAVGTDTLTGKLMDFSIGQFDTYTTLQLAQYVSTIANGGYRVAPKMLKEIHEPSEDGTTIGPLVEEVETKILNRINNTDAEINQVKRGMKYVYYGKNGTARNLLAGAKYDAGGKTGTAQADYYGDDKSQYGKRTINLSHVGFAPFDNPEVAYAIVIPHISTNQRKYPPATNELTRAALDIYFDLKEKRLQEGNRQSVDQPILPSLEQELAE